jgi:hypothetical protein
LCDQSCLTAAAAVTISLAGVGATEVGEGVALITVEAAPRTTEAEEDQAMVVAGTRAATGAVEAAEIAAEATIEAAEEEEEAAVLEEAVEGVASIEVAAVEAAEVEEAAEVTAMPATRIRCSPTTRFTSPASPPT